MDTETTGLFPYRHDRIIEVAAVVLAPDGSIGREFVTLVNPQRDIGPSSIHGLSSEDVLEAPEFAEIAPLLLAAMDGAIAVAGHNVRFDWTFLEREFERIDTMLPACPRLCTMHLAGGGALGDCCCHLGVPFDGEAHSALADARAAARLLHAVLARHDEALREFQPPTPIAWPKLKPARKVAVTRDESRRRTQAPPSYLQRLVGRRENHLHDAAHAEAQEAYLALLDRVLEDRRVEDCEVDALVEMAEHWGLSGVALGQLHRLYLDQLAVAAWADGVVTDIERKDLGMVARLLGQPPESVDEALQQTQAKPRAAASAPAPVPAESLAGQSVCFTGEFQCRYHGEPLTREQGEELAAAAGLTITASVTKKTDLLVVADPNSQSGKAKKARQYGVRILHEPVFWRSIGVNVE